MCVCAYACLFIYIYKKINTHILAYKNQNSELSYFIGVWVFFKRKKVTSLSLVIHHLSRNGAIDFYNMLCV